MLDILKLPQRFYFPGNFIPLHSSDGKTPNKENAQPEHLQPCEPFSFHSRVTPAAPDAGRWLSPASRVRAVTDVPVLAHGRLEAEWPQLKLARCALPIRCGSEWAHGGFRQLSGCSSAFLSWVRGQPRCRYGGMGDPMCPRGPAPPPAPIAAGSTKFKPAAPGASRPASSALPARGDSGTPPSGPSRRSWKTFRTASQLDVGSAPSEAAARSRTARVRTARRKLFPPMARDRR